MRLSYMAKEAVERGLLVAAITAFIVFCSALLTAVEQQKVSTLVLVSALLTAVIVFCQKFLEMIQSERETEDPGSGPGPS